MEPSELDNITLSAAFCNRLYKNGIVNLNTKERKTVSPIPFKGNNAKNVLILIDIGGELKKEDQTLLENLLTACNLSMDDVALVNMSEQEATLSDIIKRLSVRQGVLFGVPALSMDISFTGSEETLLYYENKTFIKTLPLTALQNHVPKKKALWAALQKMFDL